VMENNLSKGIQKQYLKNAGNRKIKM
jgi:hypothetical protein